MRLKTTLLASVALGGLMAAPALARSSAPHIVLAAPHGVSAHVKSGVTPTYHQNTSNFTETQTFTGTIPVKEDYKKTLDLLGDTWYSTANCTEPSNEKWKKLKKKTKYATIGTTTLTGSISACPGTTFTFPTITYDLVTKPTFVKGKKAPTDKVSGDLYAHDFNGYNLTLVAHVDLTFEKKD
jgi:hypothetical protein